MAFLERVSLHQGWLLRGVPLYIYLVMLCILFCRVIDGWDTLDDLEKIPVHEKTLRPTTNIRMRRVTIHANPLAE